MEILFDVTPSASLFATGIPNYMMKLADKLPSLDCTLLGEVNHLVLEPDATKMLLADTRNRWHQTSEQGAPPRKAFAKRLMDFTKRQARSLPISSQVIRSAQLARTYGILKRRKPVLQHLLSHSFEHNFGLPLAFTVFDLSPLAHPDYHEAHNITVFKKSLGKLERVISQGQPVRLLCISESTRRELGKYAGEAFASRSRVTPLAVDHTVFTPPAAGQKPLSRQRHGRFILSVGTLEPRKNLGALLRAFEELAASEKDLKLVLMGAKGWKNESLFDTLAKHPFKDRIEVMGHVSQQELVDHYRGCDVFCYPSLYEGFGLPVLEAMACGAPVVCSDRTSLPEVGGSAAVYFDPDHDKLSEKILKTLAESENWRVASLEQAAGFSWRATAQRTVEVYGELVSKIETRSTL